MATLTESIQGIREALVDAEKAIDKLHRRLERGFTEHGHLLGFNEGEISTLAGGGTAKH